MTQDSQQPSFKIAFILGRFPVLSEAFILNQIAGLLDRGHQVDVYALEGYSGEDKVHPLVAQHQLAERGRYIPSIPDNFARRCLKAGQLLLRYGWQNPGVVFKSLNIFRYGKQAASLRLFYGAIACLDAPQYDLIHCQFGIYALQGKYPEDAGVLALRSLGLLSGKLLVGFRGWDISWYVQQQGTDVYQQLFKTADFFLTNCHFFRDRAVSIGCPSPKIEVLGSGIDCQKFRFHPRHWPKDGTIRLATTGRLVEKKGIEYAIRAVARAIQEYPQIEYNIIGDGYLRHDLQQLIAKLGLEGQIVLRGWCQQEEIIDILDHSQIFLAPCVTAQDGNQDAPVNTLKEAMAMGLPVISTVHGGIPELVQDGRSGYLVPERDPQAIAQKILYLIAHPQLWPDIGRQGRDFVEQHYDMEPLNDQLVAVYRRCLISPNNPTPL
ncbi:MAG: glycosyltransferase [Cyanobacteria bacterium J06623_7]